MLIYNPPHLPTYSLVNTQQSERELIGWTLKWQQKQLIVKARKLQTPQNELEFAGEQRLQECLQKSLAKIVQIDPLIGVPNLKLWATACKQAKKAIFLRNVTAQELSYLYPFRWKIKRASDFLAAIFLLVVLSPIMLGRITGNWVKDPNAPVFSQQWRVGKRGQLFQLLEFNSSAAKDRDYWQKLPQLFNVLRGEMSLVGARPWNLTEASSLERKQQLNLPGITGIPETISSLAVDLDYNSDWSLSNDLRILIKTLPRFFSSSRH